MPPIVPTATPVSPPVIEFDDVVQSYGQRWPFARPRRKVLDGIDLCVRRGGIVCLLGPSGAGKTTMVNLMVGNTVPKSGTVRVLGERAPYQTVRRKIGYMPQDSALYDDITAEENLRFFGAMNGLRGDGLDARVEAMLGFARLHDMRRNLVSTFSGGMKRRLSLAVAMLHSPDLLILDEPTVGLDPDHRLRIWSEFERMAGDGITLLVTTHVMDEAARCDEIAMVWGGSIIAYAPPRDILRSTGCANLEEAFLKLGSTRSREERDHA